MKGNVPLPFDITIKKLSDGSEEHCAGTIADSDWALLQQFRQYADDLRETKWVRAGLDTHFSIDGQGAETKVEFRNRPSTAFIAELLHKLRPLVLENEATHYPRMNKMLRRYFDNQYLRDRLDIERRIYQHGRFRLYAQIGAGSLPLFDAGTYLLWLNAFEYHRDAKKQRQLIRSLGGELHDLALAVFYSITADRTQVILQPGVPMPER